MTEPSIVISPAHSCRWPLWEVTLYSEDPGVIPEILFLGTLAQCRRRYPDARVETQ
jgi:hypothetical protein